MSFTLVAVLIFTLFILLEGAKDGLDQVSCPPQLSDAVCYQLLVPLDHANKTSEKIPIQFGMVVPSNPDRAKSALLYLPGGPGQSGLNSGFLDIAFANALNKTIISVDPRGTGSLSRLNCSLPEDFNKYQPLDVQTLFTFRDCLSTLGSQAIHYSTQAVVEDLEILRRTLEFDQYDLVAVSYGTIFSQMYALKYPGKIRSMILDSPQPLQIDPYTSRHPAAYKRILKANNVDNPNFDFDAFITDLDLVLRRLRKSTELQIQLNLSPVIVRSLYQSASRDFVEAITNAARNKNYTGLIKLQEVEGNLGEFSINVGAFLATLCNDLVNNVPWRPHAETSERLMTFYNDAIANVPSGIFEPFTISEGIEITTVCLSFPFKQLRREGLPSPPLPRQKDIPALVLVGELDRRTPLEDNVLLDPVLGSKVALVKGATHALTAQNNTCSTGLLREFLATNRVKNLSACA